MSEFTVRAESLVERITSEPSDPGVQQELEALRTLWRTLSEAERADAADAARAIAQARAPATAPSPTPIEDDDAAQLALKGLDRINVDAAPERRYDGPRDPDALLAHFGLDEFRPGQREAVAAALAGRDSLVVMPTGGGKSLCYQLPGIASERLTVVVSPLIALMADQYRRLLLGGHPAAMIASGMDADAAARGAGRRPRAAAPGSCCARPERFASSAFLAALAQRKVGPVRRRRGPLRVGVGPRLPARLPAPAGRDRAARLADGDGLHRDGDRAGGRGDQRRGSACAIRT